MDDLCMRAIAQSQGKNHPIAGRSSETCCLDHGTGNGMQDGDIANRVKADVLLAHASDFFAKIDPQDTHEHSNFRTGTVKVFRRQGKEGERWNAKAAARRNNLINRLHSRTMPDIPWQIALLRPTAIAIHDNGQMSGKLILLQLTEQHRVHVDVSPSRRLARDALYFKNLVFFGT